MSPLRDLGRVQGIRGIVRETREARTKGNVFHGVCGWWHGEGGKENGLEEEGNQASLSLFTRHAIT